jgi:hypothetical protein
MSLICCECEDAYVKYAMCGKCEDSELSKAREEIATLKKELELANKKIELLEKCRGFYADTYHWHVDEFRRSLLDSDAHDDYTFSSNHMPIGGKLARETGRLIEELEK